MFDRCRLFRWLEGVLVPDLCVRAGWNRPPEAGIDGTGGSLPGGGFPSSRNFSLLQERTFGIWSNSGREDAPA
ncbi:hypothetical protein TRIP_B330053 [uncultured Desulfatiglans sp.]|nr:hypothetical protein TRIP_B330053 [uncultured Desulfatiglans sp.]